VREVFRHRQNEMGAFDVVVRVNRPFDRSHYAVVREELLQHLSRLPKCQKSSSGSSAPISS
jgi:ribonuclease P protein component